MNPLNTLKTIAIIAVLAISACSDSSNRDNASAYVERSSAYESQNQYRAALIEIRNAMKADPENVDYAIQYANLLTTIGSPNQAEILLNGFKKDHINEVRLPLSKALLQQGKFVSANELLIDWKENDAEKSQYSLLNAKQTYLRGDTEDSLQLYRNLIKSNNSSIEASYDLVSLLIQERKIQEANQRTDQLLALHPEDATLRYYKAKIAHLQGDLPLAEEQLTEALKYEPDADILLGSKVQILDLLVTVLTESGKHTEALVYNNIIKEANPEQFAAKQQYKDALDAASTGDLTTAKAAFEDILNQFPNNQQAALLLGLIHLEEGDIKAGEELLSENINVETAPINLIQATTIAQAEQGKTKEAIAGLERALLARPDDITLLSLYGVISLNSGENQQGLQAINKAIELDPSKTRLHLLLAQYYASQKNIDIALGHLRKAYSINPTDWPTTSYYVSLLFQNNDLVEFKNIKQDIIENHIDQKSAKWVVATMDYRLGEIELATGRFNELLQEDPTNINVSATLTRIYQQQQDFDRAAEMALQSLKSNPTNVGFLESVIRNKSRTLNTSELISWLEQESQQQPELTLPLSTGLVEIMVTTRQFERIPKVANRFMDSTQPMAKLIQANVFKAKALQEIEKQNWQPALSLVDDALGKTPNNITLTIMGANLAFQLNNQDNAVERIDRALEVIPNNAKLINVKAKFMAETKTAEDALKYLQPFWDESPSAELANMYIPLVRKVDSKKTEAALLELIEVEPDNIPALMLLAGEKLTLGKTTDAENAYLKILSLNENHLSALNNLAWLLKDTKHNSALNYAEKAASLSPENASVLDTYAMVLYASGKSVKAKEIINQALALDPENKEIIDHKKQIDG